MAALNCVRKDASVLTPMSDSMDNVLEEKIAPSVIIIFTHHFGNVVVV